MSDRTPWQWWEVCLLALDIWREARGEPHDAQIAVGCSVRVRVDNPRWWGNDWVSVITKKWQYSSMGGPGDPQLIVYPQASDSEFEDILTTASMIHDRTMNSPLRPADSYYDDSIAAPAWATPETFVGKIGRLNFHNVGQEV